jgi:ElaB/YqjD/DUF883 family membrane-anchored ribosome-binding protein
MNPTGTRTRPTIQTGTPAQAPIDASTLDAVLAKLETEHATLLGLAHEHKKALAHASVDDLQRITMQTSEVLMRIAKIERDRQQLMAGQAQPIDTLDDLLQRFGADDRSRISERRVRLRSLIEQVREEQQAVRIASENLANHMRGLMKQVSASLSHAGTYSRGGSIDVGRTQVVSALDTVQ